MILFSSMFLYEYSTDMIAKAVKLSECDGVEFWVETPYFWIDRNTEKLESLLDFELLLHAPVLDLNPVSVNSGVCDLSLKETLYTISLCKKVGGKLVTIHAGKRSASREPVWTDYNSLHRYLRISSNFSRIKGVQLSLENSERKVNSLCKTAEEVEFFASSYGLWITYDIKHSSDEKFLKLVERIKNVHVSSEGDGKHVMASKSEKVYWILKELSEMGYRGYLTIELDDLGIGNLDFEKKVEILRKEADFLRRIFPR